MHNLCLIFNLAPKYRAAIFKEIDNQWNCNWFFGSNSTDIKGLDLSILKKSHVVKNKKIFGHWYWQEDLSDLSSDDRYSLYFVHGDPYCLSNWLLALKLRLKANKQLYFWTHGWYGRESLLTSLLKKIYFKLADGVFLYGEYAKKLMIKEGFDESELFVLHNSLNYEEQKVIRESLSPNNIYKKRFNNSNATVIFIGRLTPEKKLNYILEASKILGDKGLSINIVFVGDGAEKTHLQELSSTLGLNESVWFYGACYDEQTNAELIYNAELCVSPGNIGLTAIHSMMFGTPCITHNNKPYQGPEFEAIIPGKTGDFFEQDNVEDLAEKIKEWLVNQENKRQIVRTYCYAEIDNNWTPKFQIDVLKEHLK